MFKMFGGRIILQPTVPMCLDEFNDSLKSFPDLIYSNEIVFKSGQEFLNHLKVVLLNLSSKPHE